MLFFTSKKKHSSIISFYLGKSKKDHIKKPLNAFMLYMKEMRPVVQAECTLKESAAINQILGRRVRKVPCYFIFLIEKKLCFYFYSHFLMFVIKEKKRKGKKNNDSGAFVILKEKIVNSVVAFSHLI